ncbi:orotate phosphoribosyltransferase [Nitriliruptoraceae bacterium ZYF776]|nr:orotate phosphoribosyltransferase [Profundirhabdus halotolerans]
MTDLASYAALLVRNDVLRFGDLVTKSGRPTPYFANFGQVRSGAAIAELGRHYADAIVGAFGTGVDVVFGPAYKGIPLAVTAAQALATHHGHDVGFAFDRKEVKDHGEGGSLVGHQLVDGDRVVIVEDVTTAGTSVRETVPKLRAVADVEVVGLVIGLDRQERGPDGEVSALDQLADEYGLRPVALTTITELADHLLDREVDGRVVVGATERRRIADHLATYGVS